MCTYFGFPGSIIMFMHNDAFLGGSRRLPWYDFVAGAYLGALTGYAWLSFKSNERRTPSSKFRGVVIPGLCLLNFIALWLIAPSYGSIAGNRDDHIAIKPVLEYRWNALVFGLSLISLAYYRLRNQYSRNKV